MEGYYNTPNLMVPLNKRDKGEIADVALVDLEKWQAVAIEWPVYTDGRCNRCTDCHQNVWFSTDPRGYKYTYTDDEILALKVAHVRQCHDQ
jgi:hypothetical protein